MWAEFSWAQATWAQISDFSPLTTDAAARVSAFNFCDPFDHVLPVSDGTVGKADRAHLWGLYSGIEVSASAVIFLVPLDEDADDDSSIGATATVGSTTSLDTTIFCQGGGSWNFPGTGDATTGVVSYPNNSIYAFTNTFIIRGKVWFADPLKDDQLFISFYRNISNNRSWHIGKFDDAFISFWSDDGSTASPATTISRTVAWGTNRWHDIAVSRDPDDDIRMFFEGEQQGVAVNVPFDMNYAAAVGPLRLGGFDSSPDPGPLQGNLDEWSITTGAYIDADFTPISCIGGGTRRQRALPAFTKRRRNRCRKC